MVAARRDDVHAIAIISAPAVDGEQTMLSQNRKIAAATGADKKALDLQEKVLKAFHQKILASQPIDDAFVEQVVSAIRAELPENERAEFKIDKEMAEQFQQFNSEWYRYFISYDPQPALRKLKIPILAILGELDMQTDPELNSKEFERIFAQSGNSQAVVKVIPKLNHLMQTAQTGMPLEYGQLAETISPTALTIITEWLNIHAFQSKSNSPE
jgi:pimeloyl-ACP methyl ester carboxylesterase